MDTWINRLKCFAAVLVQSTHRPSDLICWNCWWIRFSKLSLHFRSYLLRPRRASSFLRTSMSVSRRARLDGLPNLRHSSSCCNIQPLDGSWLAVLPPNTSDILVSLIPPTFSNADPWRKQFCFRSHCQQSPNAVMALYD